MRYMRLVASLLILPTISGVITGCGGGSGSTAPSSRTVTITIVWATATSKATLAQSVAQARGRALVTDAQQVTLEVFDGTTRILGNTYGVQQGKPTTTITLNLPAKSLTFYANAYASTVASKDYSVLYNTDPATGQPDKVQGASLVPLALTDEHPLAHGVTVVDLSKTNPIITFTMINNIAAFLPTAADPTKISGPVIVSIPLYGGPVSLSNTIKAVTADGAVVMTPTYSTASDGTKTPILTWTLPSDPTANDSLFAHVDPTDPTNIKLVPTATGSVRLTVTDSQSGVNNGGAPISSTLVYNVTADSTVLQPVTVDTTTTASLFMGSLPLYAQSVTYTVTQVPLFTGDTPPSPIPALINGGPINVVQTRNTTTAPINLVTALTLPSAITTKFTPTGRNITVTANAWSAANGAGTLLATGSTTFTPDLTKLTTGTTQQVALVSKVTSFNIAAIQNNTAQLTSITNGITPTVTALSYAVTSTPYAGAPNTLTLQTSANVSTGATTTVIVPIDPATLATTITPATANSNVTVTYPAAAVDGNGFPLSPTMVFTFNPAIVPSLPLAAPGMVVKVDDRVKATGNPATANVNLYPITPQVNFQ